MGADYYRRAENVTKRLRRYLTLWRGQPADGDVRWCEGAVLLVVTVSEAETIAHYLARGEGL